jgi:hypothetical protein
MWQNHLGEGFITKINLSDSRWNENTINTHKYNTIYWSSCKSYYNFSSRINYTEEVWSQNHASKDKLEFAEAISLNGQNILFALKENVILRHSKPEDPSTESNPHRFRLPTDNPRWHRRQEETVPHLHTKDSKSKAWATMLSKTDQKDHLSTCRGFNKIKGLISLLALDKVLLSLLISQVPLINMTRFAFYSKHAKYPSNIDYHKPWLQCSHRSI